jgi:sulfonate transport system substrate-binding protein
LTVGNEGTDSQFGFIASGLFSDMPYKVKYATFDSPTDILTALESGHCDMANNVAQWTATQAAAAAKTPYTAATAPYKNVLITAGGDPAHFSRFVIAASAQSGLTDIKAAKGKKWGIIPGSSLELFAYVVLHKLGWSTKDVTLVSLDATNQALALQTGQVDILFNVVDNLATALQDGAKLIGTAHEYGLTIYTGFLTSSAALASSSKSLAVKDFVRRLTAYQNWYIQNPSAAQAALVKYQELKAAQAKTVWKYTRVIPEAPDAAIARYSQTLADFGFKNGLLPKRVDAAALLEDRYASTIDATVKKTDLLAHLQASYS